MNTTPFDVEALVGGPSGLSAMALRGDRSSDPHLLHVTAIRDYIDARFSYSRRGKGGGSRQNKGGGSWQDDDVELAGSMGFAFEDALEEAIGRALAESAGATLGLVRHFEVGPVDGIVGSPDGYDPILNELWEFKVTWRSVLTSPPDSWWKWQFQMKCYCAMMEVSVMNLVACYLCGDYRPPKPRLLGIRFDYTEQDLTENWKLAKEGVKEMRKG